MFRRAPVIAAVVLTVVGELEVALATAEPTERLVSALALPALTLPLAWSRRAPLQALAFVALALLLQAAAGGFLVGAVATTVIALAWLLYCAARYTSTAQFAGAAAAGAVVAVTRVAFDPAAQSPRDALLTFVAVATPLLVGRWASEQRLLQRELADRAARRAHNRARDALHAAEEERARIAADLQSAVAGGLQTIVDDTRTLHGELEAGDTATARERFAAIAGTARAALADVRRVLGVLRHDGEPRRLAPPRTEALATPPATAEPSSLPPRTVALAAQPTAEPAPPAPRTVALAAQPTAEPTPPAPRTGALAAPDALSRLRGPFGDRLLAAAVLAIAATELAIVSSGAAPLTAVAIAAPLLWRRRWPVAAALAVLAAVALQSVLTDLDSFPLGDVVAMVAGSYAIGAYAERPFGVLLLAAGTAAHALLFYPSGIVAALLGGVALPWTVGRVVRANRDLTRAGRHRNAEIERGRQREARAAVTRERARVARELHDAVAHNISVIAIQAGGGEGLVDRDLERAEQCAALIATVAQEALAELNRLTGLPATADAGAPPSLSRVDELAGRARAAGLAVTLSVDGRPPALPAGIDLAAFRIVQEALANTAKHARAGRASVTVRYAPRAIELEIADDGRGSDGTRRSGDGGHGLIGMRERVALYGGSIETGPRSPRGGYLVRARLPLDVA